MTKKHFQAIAKILHDAQRTGDKATVENITRALIEMFRAENPRFDVDRFLKACGINE